MRIKVDFNNMLCTHVGKHGIDPAQIQARAEQYKAAAAAMEAKRAEGDEVAQPAP